MGVHLGLNIIITAIIAHEIWLVDSDFEETGKVSWRDTLSAYLISASIIALIVNNVIASIPILF
jgi:hypothetical protein